MNSVGVNKAVLIAPPYRDGSVSTMDGVTRLPTVASSAMYLIPDKWKNRYVTFQAIGLDVQIQFGESASVSVTKDQTSSVTTNVITDSAAAGYTILAGTVRELFIPRHDSITGFAMVSSGTTGFLEAYPSDNIHPSKTA